MIIQNSIMNAFTQGDIKGLDSLLLHSAYWSQHDAKLYGSEKLNIIVGNLLSVVGKTTIAVHQSIRQANHYVINLIIEPENSGNSVNYILWLECNQHVIKSVNAIVDTVQLATLSKRGVKSISDNLPIADPLIISDYDQQDHLQNELAWPSNLIDGHDDKIEILDQWWSIWIQRQLANIDKVYAEDAIVSLPGQIKQTNQQGLFDFVLSVTSNLTRVFTQIEDIALEDKHVAIKWFLDADEANGKIRLPFITLLEIDNGKIVSDTTLCDILSFNKRFNQSRIFNQISPNL